MNLLEQGVTQELWFWVKWINGFTSTAVCIVFEKGVYGGVDFFGK